MILVRVVVFCFIICQIEECYSQCCDSDYYWNNNAGYTSSNWNNINSWAWPFNGGSWFKSDSSDYWYDNDNSYDGDYHYYSTSNTYNNNWNSNGGYTALIETSSEDWDFTFSITCLLLGDFGCEISCCIESLLFGGELYTPRCSEDWLTCECHPIYHMINGNLTEDDFLTLSFDELWDNTFESSSYSTILKKRIKKNDDTMEYVLQLLRNAHITGNDIKSKLMQKYPRWREINELKSVHLGLKNDLFGDGYDVKYDDIIDHFEDLLLEIKNNGFDFEKTTTFRRRIKQILNQITDEAELKYILSLVKLTGNQQLYNYFKNHLINRGYFFEEDALMSNDDKETSTIKTNVISMDNVSDKEIIELSVVNKFVTEYQTVPVVPAIQQVSTESVIVSMECENDSFENSAGNLNENSFQNVAENIKETSSMDECDSIHMNTVNQNAISENIISNLPQVQKENSDFNGISDLSYVYQTPSEARNEAMDYGIINGGKNVKKCEIFSESENLAETADINQKINGNVIDIENSFSISENSNDLIKDKKRRLYYFIMDDNGEIKNASEIKREYFTEIFKQNELEE